MSKFYKTLASISGVLTMTMPVWAQETLVKENANVDMVVSIYNNNLGLVDDSRNVSLKKGENEVAFEGVSALIKPESAIITGKDIQVLEQNYDYDLLTSENLLESYIGKEVKTAQQNPANGETIFNKAVLLSGNYAKPILRFDYGVEANFPGRVVYNQVPENLRVKPTLVALLDSKKQGKENLSLTYLTGGLSWKADYVAEIINEDKLNLKTWVTIKNETGADYKNAQIRLVSGNVNQVMNNSNIIRPMLAAKAVRMEGAAMDSAVSAAGISPENVADYYMYKLPYQTDIKNKQSKQISFMELNQVGYQKEYRFQSPLYLNIGVRNGEFEKQHPDIVFILKNDPEYKLGYPLPSGMMRFYENKNNNMIFLGENRIEQTAVGQKAELSVGKAFDIYAQGKISKVTAISKDIYEYDVEVTFNNVSNQEHNVVFEQNIYNDWQLLSDNLNGKQKNSSTMYWKFELPAKEKKILQYKVRINRTI